MQLENTLGIVLKSTLFEERSQVITALTEKYGMIQAVAKNSVHSKRFAGSLGLFLCF